MVPLDIAVDPVDGTTNISKGLPNVISVLAAGSAYDGLGKSLRNLPSFYSEKLAYGPRVKNYLGKKGAETLTLEAPIEETVLLGVYPECAGETVTITMLLTARGSGQAHPKSWGATADDRRRRCGRGDCAEPGGKRDGFVCGYWWFAGSSPGGHGATVSRWRHAGEDVATR